MKHSVFFMTLTTIALVSCSKDETTGINQGCGIEFRPAIGKTTRAAETTTANLKEIHVVAFNEAGERVFSDVFKKEADPSTFWTAAPNSYFWPSDGSQYSFPVYSPSATELGGTVTLTKDEKKLSGYSPAAGMNDQKDFVVAYNTGSKTNEEAGVPLLFKHALSQIQINAKNANGGYIFKVKGVRIGKVGSKGDFTFPLQETKANESLAADSWTLDADNTKANYQSEYDTEIVLKADAQVLMGDNGNAMLIPQQLTAWNSKDDLKNTTGGAYLAVKVNITTKDGGQIYPAKVGEYDWTAVAIGTNWEAGKKYVYTLNFTDGAGKVDPEKPDPTDPTDPFNPGEDITGGKIKFTVEVEEWTETPVDVEM